uniref:Uncharacterized protein n=1 Tax=Picea glauca TaxID=3330 RepID=A0A101LUT3_PICGL|nr:hypothetical protein ABT39_MTgene2335 [Picea glauca]QHR89316.1 hypothetical protein Q903MT_gene3337 [Picea sitchensis]
MIQSARQQIGLGFEMDTGSSKWIGIRQVNLVGEGTGMIS